MIGKSKRQNLNGALVLGLIGVVLIAATWVGVNHYVDSVVSSAGDSSVSIYPYTADQRKIYANSDVFTKSKLLQSGITLGTLKANDADYYTFEVATISYTRIELHNIPNIYDLTVYSPNKDVVTRGMNNGPTTDDIDLTLNPGQYYLRIYNTSGTYPTRPYTLEFSLTPVSVKTNP